MLLALRMSCLIFMLPELTDKDNKSKGVFIPKYRFFFSMTTYRHVAF